jgi:hypothetical protein
MDTILACDNITRLVFERNDGYVLPVAGGGEMSATSRGGMGMYPRAASPDEVPTTPKIQDIEADTCISNTSIIYVCSFSTSTFSLSPPVRVITRNDVGLTYWTTMCCACLPWHRASNTYTYHVRYMHGLLMPLFDVCMVWRTPPA